MRTAMAAVMIAAGATSACGHARDEDPGPMVSRNFPVGNFTQVEVAGPFNVDIRTGGQPSVNAKGNEALLDRLEVEVEGNRLLIHTKKDRKWFGGWSSRGKASIAITVPMIEAATLAGSGGLAVDKVTGDRFEGQIAGSGDLKVGSVDVGNLKLGIAGSGGATAAGKARSASYEIAGSGSVDARNLPTEELDVSIAGSGGVRAHATKTAKVDIMGSGNVEVAGGAKCSVSKAGSGNVTCP